MIRLCHIKVAKGMTLRLDRQAMRLGLTNLPIGYDSGQCCGESPVVPFGLGDLVP